MIGPVQIRMRTDRLDERRQHEQRDGGEQRPDQVDSADANAGRAGRRGSARRAITPTTRRARRGAPPPRARRAGRLPDAGLTVAPRTGTARSGGLQKEPGIAAEDEDRRAGSPRLWCDGGERCASTCRRQRVGGVSEKGPRGDRPSANRVATDRARRLQPVRPRSALEPAALLPPKPCRNGSGNAPTTTGSLHRSAHERKSHHSTSPSCRRYSAALRSPSLPLTK